MPTSITLKQLHAIVQAAMAWEDYHLWEFAVGREPIGSSRAAKVTLQTLLRPRVTRLFYIYDFGDCWEHLLTLTKPRPADPASTYPRYLAGENAAPPEDCGGIAGFYAQLEMLADPNHPDHHDAKEWFARLRSQRLRRTARQGPDRPGRQPSPNNADQKQIAVIGRRLRRACRAIEARR